MRGERVADRPSEKEILANRKAHSSKEWKNKILTPDRLALKASLWRQCGWDIVLTCGCFDVLHVGHLRLLRDAAAHGNLLLVGINSDESVRKLKGDRRPLVSQTERAEMLAGLTLVDGVTIFDEETPISLIQTVQPAFFCKGGDYRREQLVEASAVEAHGGKVVILPFTRGHSSTGLIDKLAGMGDV
jgi:rfaE bifunctional protein nucleotidyltransferase chain/domain